MTHCKIRLSLGSAMTQNQSIFYWPNNVFILYHMFQGFIPKKMNAKSHPALRLAQIASLAQKSEMRQWRLNCASIARQIGMSVNFMAQRSARGIIHDHPRRPSCCDLALMAFFGAKTGNAIARFFGVILAWASISRCGGRQGVS